MADIYAVVTDRIVSLIKNGRFTDAMCPWNRERTTTISFNAFTGSQYKRHERDVALEGWLLGWRYREGRWLTFD